MTSTVLLLLSVLLALIILAQSAKGNGLAPGFKGAYQIAGVKRTASFMNRATQVLGGALMLFCLVG